MGAALFGFSKLYGEVPGAQAEYLRVPQAQFMPIKVPEGPIDERFLFLSDVLPTAWQSVVYADVPKDGTLLVLGLGPIGDMATRIALHQGLRVIAVDRVPERLARAACTGRGGHRPACRGRRGRGGAVAHRGPRRRLGDRRRRDGGARIARGRQRDRRSSVRCRRSWSAAMMSKVGLDRMNAIHTAIDAVRRGGTVSLIGVYGGQSDPMPMLTLFDKQIQLRMGQANVKRWVDDIMPLLVDDADPLGTEEFATHEVPLAEAPVAYEKFQKKLDGTIKVVFKP